MKPQLVRLLREMAAFTQPECAKCRVPFSCCDDLYGSIAEDEMKEQGVKIPPHQPNARCRFLSPTGCVVSPEHRILCTLHTCDINGFGCKRGDVAWTNKYFKLRGKIEAAM